jgi:aminopeptidase N
MKSTRYCKCHSSGLESDHWGILDRRAFADKGARPHYAPDTPVRPVHLKLDLAFDWEEERVHGSTTYSLEVLAQDVREIALDAANLEIRRATVGGRSVGFENTGERLVLFPKTRLKAGARVTVRIEHSVTRPAAGIYFTKPDEHYPDRFRTVWTQGQDEDSRYYFPCFDQPNFKQTSEVILRLPAGMFGLSNGKRVGHKATRSGSLFHYRMELPYSTYLLSIVAGVFAEHRARQGGVDIIWYVQKGREEDGVRAFKDTGKMLRFFSDYTGFPYPYPHYTQIAVPEFIFGGMENFTVTTQTDLVLLDERATLDIDANGLVAHEAAHTWFGNVVTAKQWSHAWLHESFATYFDALYTRESKGEAEFRYQLLEDAETYFSEDTRYRRPIVTRLYKEPIDLFDAHLYPGGAVRLHHLRAVAGEAYFRKALKVYLNRHQYGLVETVDWVRALEEVTGRNFDQWLEEWIYRGGYPELQLGFSWDQATRMATVSIKQMQKGESKKEELLFHLRLTLAFYYPRGEERFEVDLHEKEEKFCFKLKSKPLFFRLDPDYECPTKKVTLEVPRPMLHRQLKNDIDPTGRIEAAAHLLKKTSSQDIEVLGQALRKEGEWGVAERIAGALGKIGGAQARDLLLKALPSGDPKIRRGVVRALGAFLHDDKVARALRKTAAGDASYRVEAEALASLGRIKGPAARPFLETALERPSHNNMAQSAIYNALAELEDENSWEILIRGAEYGARKNSRGAAMRAMAKLARRFEARRGEAMEHLRRFARETRGTPAAVFRGKLEAIQSLKMLDDLAAVPVLRALAANETDGRLSRQAGEAVAHLFESARKPKELGELRSELDDVSQENKALRERLDLVEKKQEAALDRKARKGKTK